MPTWATDRLRRKLGNAAPARDQPVVLAGRSGNRREVLLASVGERGAPFRLPHGRGDEFHHGGWPDQRGREQRALEATQLPTNPKARDIYIPDLSLDTIRLKAREFH